MVMGYTVWPEMFGNGVAIGMMPIIINYLKMRLLWILQGLKKVLIRRILYA